MALFNGVENFTPAFTGRQLAIASGQGAGQSISRGQQVAQRQQMIDFETDMKALDTWAGRRKSALTKPTKDSVAVPWNQIPIPGPLGQKTGPAVPWNEMPIPGPKGPGTREAFPFTSFPGEPAVPWDEMPIPEPTGF